MLTELFKVRILKANILVYGENAHEIDVLTGFPYESNKCGMATMKRIQKFKRINDTHSFSINHEINLVRLSNLNGCLLKVDHGAWCCGRLIWKRSPFTFNDIKTNELDGIDVRILKRR